MSPLHARMIEDMTLAGVPATTPEMPSNAIHTIVAWRRQVAVSENARRLAAVDPS